MRHLMLLVSGMLTASLLAGCGGYSTGPSTGAGSTGGGTTYGGGGSTGGGTGGTSGPAPITAAVTVGNNFFTSAQDNSSNPALVTVAVGGTVTWTWATTGAVPHSVQSLGSPSFASSDIKTGSGSTYQVTFTAPGTYRYDCAVHGTMMTGTIVVQ